MNWVKPTTKVTVTIVVIKKVTATSNDPVTFWGHKLGQTNHKGNREIWGHEVGKGDI